MNSERENHEIRSQSTDTHAKIEKAASTTATEDNAVSLQTRIEELENLIEQYGQSEKIEKDVLEYIQDLKDELSDLRKYRLVVTMFSILMSLGLWVVLLVCILHTPDWFEKLEGSQQVPLIISFAAGSVVLMSLLLRGTYRSRHERNHGEMLPESLKMAVEAVRSDR